MARGDRAPFGGPGSSGTLGYTDEDTPRLRLKVCAEHGNYSIAMRECPKCEDQRKERRRQHVADGLRASDKHRAAGRIGGKASVKKREGK